MRPILPPDAGRPRHLLDREGPDVWRLMAAAAGPVLYGSTAAVVLWLYSAGEDHSKIEQEIEMWFLIIKIPALIGLVFLSIWSGRALGRNGRLWLVTAGLWTVVGLAAVALYGLNHTWVEQATNGPTMARVWPTDVSSVDPDQVSGHEIFRQWSTWSDPQRVLARELLFLTTIAWAAAALARFGSRVKPWLPSAAIPIAVMAVGTLYLILNPWAFVVDYDVFIGDAVLGGTMGELYFVVLPVDLVAAIALGVAALTLVLVVVSESLIGRHSVDGRRAVRPAPRRRWARSAVEAGR